MGKMGEKGESKKKDKKNTGNGPCFFRNSKLNFITD